MFDIRDHGGIFGAGKYRKNSKIPVTSVKPFTSLPWWWSYYPRSYDGRYMGFVKDALSNVLWHWAYYDSTRFLITKFNKNFDGEISNMLVGSNTSGEYLGNSPNPFMLEKDGIVYVNIETYSSNNYRQYKMRGLNSTSGATVFTVSGKVNTLLKVTNEGFYAEMQENNSTPSGWSISFFSFATKTWTKIFNLEPYYSAMGNAFIYIPDSPYIYVWTYGNTYYLVLTLEGVMVNNNKIPATAELYNCWRTLGSNVGQKLQIGYQKKTNKIIAMYNVSNTKGGVWYKVFDAETLTTEISLKIAKVSDWNMNFSCKLNNNLNMLAIIYGSGTTAQDNYASIQVGFLPLDARGMLDGFDITQDATNGGFGSFGNYPFWGQFPNGRFLGSTSCEWMENDNLANIKPAGTGSTSCYPYITASQYEIVK
ncbi:hypothetical protein [Kurthia gibsonii]|uniref:hypothetical protein n=1 Tax=Kurthia gibsonii TaxID=33946 RepID=UPI003017899B